MLIGQQQPFATIFQNHLGAPAVFCHEAYLVFGLCQNDPGLFSISLGDSNPLSPHRLRFSRSDLAATLVDTRQQRDVAREFGIEPVASAYGIEQIGTGIGMGSVLRYDAYFCIYEQTDLERLALTEQATSDPAVTSPFPWEKLRWADRYRAALLVPYGYLIGVLQIDSKRNRLLLTGGASFPSFTVFRDRITFKAASSKGLPAVIQEQMTEPPLGAFELNRFSEWKEYTESIGRLFIFNPR